MWGKEDLVKENPIQELFKLYVKFHEEAEKYEHLNEEGREAFLKLEQGIEEYIELWKWFRAVSLASFNRIYKRLGITFDSYNGEAFYNDKLQSVIDILKGENLIQEDLDNLPEKDAVKLLQVISLIQEYGMEEAQKMKWVKKLENNLYEIRSKRGNNIQRVIYFRVVGNRYVITHGFTKKQQKTPKKEIDKGKRIRRNYFN